MISESESSIGLALYLTTGADWILIVLIGRPLKSTTCHVVIAAHQVIIIILLPKGPPPPGSWMEEKEAAGGGGQARGDGCGGDGGQASDRDGLRGV